MTDLERFTADCRRSGFPCRYLVKNRNVAIIQSETKPLKTESRGSAFFSVWNAGKLVFQSRVYHEAHNKLWELTVAQAGRWAEGR